MKLFRLDHIQLTMLFIAIVLLLTVVAHVAQASDVVTLSPKHYRVTVLQDPTAEPTPPPVVTPAPVSDLTDKLTNDVEEFLGTYGALVGLAAAFIVGVLKNIPALNDVSARILNILVSGVLVVGLLLATRFGYGSQYQAGLDALPIIGKAILALLVAFGFSTGVHEAANVYSVPIWGSKRTPHS